VNLPDDVIEILSKLLKLLDHLRVLVPFNNCSLIIIIVKVFLNKCNNDIVFHLHSFVTLDLELKETCKVLNLLLNHASLGIEDVAVTQAAVIVIDDANTSHNGDLVLIDSCNSWEPSAHYGSVGLNVGELGVRCQAIGIFQSFN